MKRQTSLFVAMLILFEACTVHAEEPKIQAQQEKIRKERKKVPLQVDYGDSTFRVENKIKLDGLGTVNANRLNKNNRGLDQTIIPGRFVYDSQLLHFFHNPACDWDTVRLKTGLRWRGVFGAPESGLKTGSFSLKDLDSNLGAHVHPLTIIVPIIREIWGEFVLNELVGLGFANVHTFTMGVFPFFLGRGIALGDAFTQTPDFIGYDPAMSVDQYAPGFKLAGSLWRGHILDYDLYAEIVDNFSDSFNNVNAPTQSHLYGQRFNQARGFGILDYIIAGRLKWTPVDTKDNKIYVEPYFLFNDARNQKIEVPQDASSKLGTIGLAMELVRGDLELGFDIAHNIGRQAVKGLDRNSVRREARTVPAVANTVNTPNCVTSGDQSAISLENSHVVLVSNNKVTVPYNPCSSPTLQAAINQPIENSACDTDLAQFNGKILPVTLYDSTTGTSLQVMNALDRFRNPYVNHFDGTMFIVDMSYRIRTNFKFAAMLGYATGDNDPNKDLDALGEGSTDGTYSGFIGLQEVYSGNRVRSAFLLGGPGRLPRITSFPVTTPGNNFELAPKNPFPTSLSRFSNVSFIAGALWWETEECARKWVINPNILSYWQPDPPRIPDFVNGLPVVTTSSRTAHNHLGTEFNVFIDNIVAPGLKVFCIAGFFVPGKYFKDLTGFAVSPAEQQYLNSNLPGARRANVTPVIGSDNAFFVNAGIEYKF